MKAGRYKALSTQYRFLNWLQSSVLISLAVHWVFQGMLYMDRTERTYKLMIDVVLALAFVVGLGFSVANVAAGLLVGHSLNFVFNGQINVVLKNFGISRADAGSLMHYIDQLVGRVNAERSIAFAAAYGSLSRDMLGDKSDVDIRLLRRPGVMNGLRSVTFGLQERARALFTGIPLDLYVVDTERSLAKLRRDEPAFVLKPVHRSPTESRGDDA